MDQRVRDRSTVPARLRGAAQPRVEAVECPRCGRFQAKIIGRSEMVPVVYLRCDGCHLTSIAAV